MSVPLYFYYRIKDFITVEKRINFDINVFNDFFKKCGKYNINYNTIVDVGCGFWYPNVKLFQANNNTTVIGVDPSFDPSNKRCYFPGNRLKDIINRIILFLYHILYNFYLKKVTKKTWDKSKIVILHKNFEECNIKSQSVDLVLSCTAFEHFENPELVVRKIGEILKPGGYGIFKINLFTSLTGGHNYSNRMPWDHLRENKIPTNTYLNKWRYHQYHDLLSAYFEIVEEELVPDLEIANKLLEPIREELKEYSDKELLNAMLDVVVRSKAR